MEYCLYLRKSRADADAEERGEGETLARHEKTLLELAKRQRLNVGAIYREIVSGDTIAARPVMQHLLAEIEQGRWDGVLVMEVERLARGDTIDQGLMAQTFKLSRTKIITPIKTYDPNNEYDEEYFEFGLFMSRREYKTINRRLQRGRLASVKEGKYASNKAPYGYERVKLQHDKGFTLTIVPEEADVVKMIYNFYTIGELMADGTYNRIGVSLIASRLNALKIPTKTGGLWASTTIRDMLINPTYNGKIRWKYRAEKKRSVDGILKKERPRANAEDYITEQGLHQAIIDDETFRQAQDFMANNRPRPIGEKNTVKNPLSGIVICGKCGRRMVRRPHTDSKTPPTLMCAEPTCDNVSVALHYVEDRMLEALEGWLHEYKLNWSCCMPQKVSLSEIKRKVLQKIDVNLEILDKQLDKAHTLLEQDIYTTEQFLSRSKRLTEAIATARSERKVVATELATEELQAESCTNVLPVIENLLEVLGELKTPKAKNDALKEILKKVIYTKNVNGRWHNGPDDFELTLFPLLPINYQDKQ